MSLTLIQTVSFAVGDYQVRMDLSDYIRLQNKRYSLKVKLRADGRVSSVAIVDVSISYPLTEFIMEQPAGMLIDHLDRDPLNNCRSNLRVATKVDNGHNRNVNKNNTMGFVGIRYHERNNKYEARLSYDGRNYRKYGQTTAREAALAYDELVRTIVKDVHATTNQSLGLL